ncbi:MAG: tetratricopeptide repeat protein [Betaproteobacteria bacterium]|nr:tetratricopeptide repeat protein [Betaproteobacteria bacterium]
MDESAAVTTFLFTDIEGSTRLWEQAPERMRAALAAHDAIARACVADQRGTLVKSTGDGIHAVFTDPCAALSAAVALERALSDPAATAGIALCVRCGMHAGVEAKRDNDFFGNAVNRAARVMSVAHGGQILVSQTVASLVGERLPEGVSLLDLGSVRLRGLAQPERVWQVAHPSLRREFPALRSLEATPNNLPQQLTSFVGRDDELADVLALLREARLLTVLGGGGFGKTRLTLQAAALALDAYADGVWLVELAPVGDPRLVPQAIASVLGVKESPGLSVQDAVLAFARARQFLLVLDNCEHVVQACADVARQLLEAGAGVTILASSREALNVRGERVYPLAPLLVPTPEAGLRAAAIAAIPSVQLFADRAASASPSFHVTDDNAESVAAICQRLDGIPLALELAAARLRSMPVERVAERLSDRFRLLTSGDRTALPRQQTLRALIDWSHDLLEPAERVLFRRLSVFAGGFTLDAAEKVGAGGDIAEGDVVDLVSRLVEKSLLMLDAAGERYRMLETVREYAREQLERAGELAATRDRQLRYFLVLAARARPELVGPRQREWLERLDAERENIVAAQAWCDRAENGGELGLQLVRSIQVYWFTRGLLGLGLQLTLDALARPGAQTRNLVRCRGLSGAGQLALYMGRHPEARRHLEESLAIAREIDDPERIAAVLQPLGMASLGVGDFVTARARLQEALALAEAIGKRREIAAAQTALAQLHRAEGALDEAEALNERALQTCRELGDRESVAVGLLNLAMVAIVRGDTRRAQEHMLQGMAIAREIGSRPAGQSAIEASAGLAAVAAEWPRAARLYGAAEAQARKTGLCRDAADEAFLRPLIAGARAALGPDRFAVAEREGWSLSLEEALDEAGAWLAPDAGRSARPAAPT